jgi:predicted NBD/HSP70 family sugar kinase
VDFVKVKRTGDLKLIQELNRSIILNMIREFGPISRSEIAKRNQISPSTVASAVKDLIEDGLVCEDGAGASSGGRKPIMVRLSSEKLFLLGVSVTNFNIAVAEMTLQATVRRKHKVDLMPEHHGENVIEDTPHMDRCIGISIIIPGIVDSARGVVYYNSKLKLSNVALKDTVESCFKLKTWIENDMNAIVLAEKKYGAYSKFHNLLYVNVGGGVGAGIVVNDAILRGSRGGAGEFGHTSVNKTGIQCECGNVGCLENYVSWPAVRSRLKIEAAFNKETRLRQGGDGDLSNLTPADFTKALREGDSMALSVMEETAALLGAGIVNVINLFNPDIVIFGGALVYGNDLMLSAIRTYVIRYALSFSTNFLEICSSSLGENAELIGAASILLQDLFQFSLT